MRSALVVLALCCVAALSAPTPLTNLPGQPPVNFDQYTGYFNPRPHRGIFYWFVESQSNPSTDPVVLWLNGGPGCSSLGGFFTENGPFRPSADGASLTLNPYSWNMNASVLYIESPAGVGFSYDNNPGYTNDDVKTAHDAYMCLVEFFSEFPQFKGRDFYIAGESYAGHYVPELVDVILNQGKKATDAGINLTGFAAGNPCTYLPDDSIGGTIRTFFTHALISERTYNGIVENCDPSVVYGDQRCNDFQYKASVEMGDIDPYDIYVPVCSQAANSNARALAKHMSKRMPIYGHGAEKAERQEELYMQSTTASLTSDDAPYFSPCLAQFTKDYLDNVDVKVAIGVDPSIEWFDCNDVHYNETNLEFSMLPIYQRVMDETNLRVFVYSGDVDTVVPYLGTQQWVNNLNRTVVAQWRPYMVNGQVGGYVTEYDRLTFVTVRDAGHMVPMYQPARAAHLFNAFITGSEL